MIQLARNDTSLLGRWWWTLDRWTLAAIVTLRSDSPGCSPAPRQGERKRRSERHARLSMRSKIARSYAL